jgi:hypothetical protein
MYCLGQYEAYENCVMIKRHHWRIFASTHAVITSPNMLVFLILAFVLYLSFCVESSFLNVHETSNQRIYNIEVEK